MRSRFPHVVSALFAIAALPGADVVLNWNDNTESDLAGYRVYRAASLPVAVTAGNRIAQGLAASAYTDAARPTGTWHYVVTAVDTAGNESVASTATSAVVAAPTAWTGSDIGGALAGSSAYDASAGTWTIAGSGADIWGSTDRFRFQHQSVSGDVTISACVVSLSNTNAWAKAGVMMRGSTDPKSRHAMTVVTPTRGVAFQRRAALGGSSASTAGSLSAAPRWVRLARTGDSLRAAESADGAAWSFIGSAVIIDLPDTALVGLCVTSHNAAVLATAVFAQVQIAPAGGG